ncbi:toll-like receptor 13 [Acipenser ruthenus]|uniref:toll-like receptor 13 n=1 Tax=Acipenser ruthenus TaxID=7906 RepID=UPI00145B42E7|nr:toll-like receptor 13 [Acipenser ruthenus]
MVGTYFIFLIFLLNCWVQIVPTSGYSLRNCTAHGALRFTGLKLLCFRRNFSHVPPDIPHNTKFLDISWNNISQLREGDFRNLIYLKGLNASNNQIHHIDRHAFKDLTALQVLNLSQNHLSALTEDLFKGLENLTELFLGGNRIQKIDAYTFQFMNNIKVMDLSANSLLQIQRVQPVFRASNLEQLYLRQNNFTSFNTEDFSNVSLRLRVLDLSLNPFRNFSVTTNIFPCIVSLKLLGLEGGLDWVVTNKSFLHSVKNLSLSGFHTAKPGILSGIIKSFANSSLKDLQLNDLQLTEDEMFLSNVCRLLPKLQTLGLKRNNFTLQYNPFVHCSMVSHLDLSWKGLKCLPESLFKGMHHLCFLSLAHNHLYVVPCAIQNISTLQTLDLGFNRIGTLQPRGFSTLMRLKVLILEGNNINTMISAHFEGLANLEELRIKKNNIQEITGTWSTALHSLRSLDMKFNKLGYINNDIFRNMHSLKYLNMVGNHISKFDTGAFKDLSNLTYLQLGKNPLKVKSFDEGDVFAGMPLLKLLKIFDCNLCYKSSEELKRPPFTTLKSLVYLSINSQGPNCLVRIPSNFLKGLSSLRELHAGHQSIDFVHPKTFSHTPNLTYLDLSNTMLKALDPKIFLTVPKLSVIHLNEAHLQSLDFLVHANLTRLKFLSSTGNQFIVVSETHIKALPLLRFLNLTNNPFICSCENAWFQNWSLQYSMTQVLNFYDITCNYPANYKGLKLADFNVDSCKLDYDFICFIVSSTLVTLTMVSSFIFHFLRWQVVYAYHLFQAFLYDRKQKPSRRYEFDAFVSYNTHDEPWVLRELLPNLEQGRGWKLCLHHRDFQPGKPIIDNIVDNIYKSRKTLCIISRHYLESEWCSREIQVASFRLFDEQKDVLVLVFLEDIPDCQLSPYHRMRKLVKKKTYLNWPKCEEETRLFWHKLNTALETREEPNEESPILTGLEAFD